MSTNPQRRNVAPWHSSRIVSLAELENFYADSYIHIGRMLGRLQYFPFDEETVDLSAASPRKAFRDIRQECRNIGLNVSAAKVDRILKLKVVNVSVLRKDVDDLAQRIIDEIANILFMRILQSHAQMYLATKPLFGEEVFQAFPSASNDISEAGKCLACERSTAAVFHLMRVMEAGLKVLARGMGIPYAPSWESYLNQIEKRVNEDYKDKTPEWKQDEKFYKQVAGDLSIVKFAWRNPTMHIVNSYIQEDAENIFNGVRVFMRRLAKSTELKSAIACENVLLKKKFLGGESGDCDDTAAAKPGTGSLQLSNGQHS